jgi:prevent-host-death family protein
MESEDWDSMRSVGLFEAKQKLSELVQRASEGERIGITRRGKLAAVIISPRSQSDLKNVFDRIEQIRKRVRRPKGFKIKELIEEGRT